MNSTRKICFSSSVGQNLVKFDPNSAVSINPFCHRTRQKYLAWCMVEQFSSNIRRIIAWNMSRITGIACRLIEIYRWMPFSYLNSAHFFPRLVSCLLKTADLPIPGLVKVMSLEKARISPPIVAYNKIGSHRMLFISLTTFYDPSVIHTNYHATMSE